MMLIETLTNRQTEIFEFIRDTIYEKGYGPTVREIGEAFGIVSPNGVAGHLDALQAKGLITRSSGKSRTLELSEQYLDETAGMPLKGVVQAGVMHEAIEQNDRVDFADFFSESGCFALKVRGDSMIDAAISDGDYVVVKPRRTASRGDIAVVRDVDGEATLKYWFPEKNRIRLQPANAKMKPIYSKTAKVIGVVVGVVRQY